jgi:hypothetical protein
MRSRIAGITKQIEALTVSIQTNHVMYPTTEIERIEIVESIAIREDRLGGQQPRMSRQYQNAQTECSRRSAVSEDMGSKIERPINHERN